MSSGNVNTPASDTVQSWLAWKQASERVRAAVIADVAAAGSLTEPELTVLVQLDHAGGALRQNALAAAAGWDRSRLSHLLTRMQQRGYLDRSKVAQGVEVRLQPVGREMIAVVQGPLQEAVHRHLTGKLTPGQRAQLDAILAALAE